MRISGGILVLFAAVLASCGDGKEPDLVTGSTGYDDPPIGPPDTTVPAPTELRIDTAFPAIVDPIGGSTVVLTGLGLTDVVVVTIEGEVATDLEILSDTSMRVRTPAVPLGLLDVTATRADIGATLDDALEAWSPAEIPGARLLDAASGIDAIDDATIYEWTRISEELPADWRSRDGNTVTWLPATGKFWMVGGWNGLQEPIGFSTVDPYDPYAPWPPENTTNEVWSSPDGVTWTPELPHGHAQFLRRHTQSTVLWDDRLWSIGGDHWTGEYIHDVISSGDGVTWTVENANPPWQPRALHTAGVFDDQLWMIGGQDLIPLEEDWVTYNDVWRSENGVDWVEVLPNGPASDTRFSPRGMISQIVEFNGRMWLLGGGVYSWVQGEYFAEVWSSVDGATWTKHATPPWAPRNWHDVFVFDGRLWVMFGYVERCGLDVCEPGNNNDAYSTADGETWTRLPMDQIVPGSHGQGVGVGPDSVILAGGNYNFNDPARPKEAWRLTPMRGLAVQSWTDRGPDGLTVSALDDTRRPVWMEDGFGEGNPGLVFDGSTSHLDLDVPDDQTAGRSVFWVARAPWIPHLAWLDDSFNPANTVVGGPSGGVGSVYPTSSAGYRDGELLYVNREDIDGTLTFSASRGGESLQESPGGPRLVGFTHGTDGVVEAWVDGASIGEIGAATWPSPRGWSRIGAGVDGLDDQFQGTIGAVVVLPEVTDAATVERLHAWAIGRFGVP